MAKRLLTFSFLFCTFITFSFAQFTVTGKVVDAENFPLIGVSVIELNTTNGTVTDIDGKYSLNVSSEDAIVTFSYLGYSTQEIIASNAGSTPVQLLISIVLSAKKKY